MEYSEGKANHGIFFHTSIYGFGHLVARGLSFILLPFYTHHISSNEFGIFSLIISFATIVSIVFHLGLQGSFVKYFSSAKSLNEQKLIFSNLIFLISSVSLPISLILIFFSKELSELFLHSRKYSASFSLGIISILAMTYSYYFAIVYVTLEKSKQFVINTVISALMNFVLNVIFIYNLSLGIDGIFYAQIISSFVLIFLCVDVLKTFFQFKFNSLWVKNILQFGYPFFFSSIFTVLTEVFDRFLVDYYLGSNKAGIYYLGYRFGLVLNIFGISFKNSWLPHYYNFISHLGDDKPNYLGKVFSKLLMVSAFVIVPISLFADDVFSLKYNDFQLFSTEYFEAAAVIPFVLLGYMFSIMMSFYSLGPYISGKSVHFLISDLLCFICNLILNILLIPFIGIIGAAIATMSAFMIGACYLNVYCLKKIDVNYEKRIIITTMVMIFGFTFLSMLVGSLYLDIILIFSFLVIVRELKVIDFGKMIRLKF
jgi:O-antigen/teichoic acid export membrane protein